MNTYLITGKNKQGKPGTWEIEANDKESLKKIIDSRGLQAERIDGEEVKRGKAPNILKGD